MTSSPLTLPSESGTYVLMLRMRYGREVTIGKLGRIDFGPGWYAYVGSAFGPGGLAARLRRHCRAEKKSHWHIDYLRREARVVGVWTAAGPRHLEHHWAGRLKASPLNGRPIIGFGCSDCRCRSHLLYFRRAPGRDKLNIALQARWIPMDQADGPCPSSAVGIGAGRHKGRP